MKTCTKCKKKKRLSSFSDGRAQCKKCLIRSAVLWAKNNPEKNRAKALRYWHAKGKYKTKKLSTT